MRGVVGVGFRYPLGAWIDSRLEEVECLEITAEHFFDGGENLLGRLRKAYPLYVHGLGLSLGTPGPLDRETLESFARVVEIADPEWISEHISFTRTQDVDLGHLNPLRPDKNNADLVADHAREVSERCGKPIILENITSHLKLQGELSETEFLNRLCEKADCGLILDVTNLYVNAKNHGFDPRSWLRDIEPKRIVQLHVVGYTKHQGHWEDYHAEPIQDDLRELIADVCAYAPVRAVIIERDSHFPPVAELAQELATLRNMLENHGTDQRARTTSER